MADPDSNIPGQADLSERRLKIFNGGGHNLRFPAPLGLPDLAQISAAQVAVDGSRTSGRSSGKGSAAVVMRVGGDLGGAAAACGADDFPDGRWRP